MHWRATYKNGETVTEEDGVSSDRLNREQLASFSIMAGEREILTVRMIPGRKLFYRRRVEQSQGGPVRACHIVGWFAGDSLTALYVFEGDGTIEMVGEFDDQHPWHYRPIFLPHEGIGE